MSEPQLKTIAWRRDRLVQLLLATAILIACLFSIVHLAGLRPYTSILSGSLPETSVDFDTAVLYGLLYTASYFAFVIVAPICLIAAAVYGLLLRVMGRRAQSIE